MSNSNFSKFNLIAPKTKEEIITIQERDNSVLYAFLLIFFSVVIFAVFTIGKTLLIDTREKALQDAIKLQESQIAGYDQVKKINGEIFIKSNALSPIVKQDIKLSELLDVVSKLIVESPGTVVTRYDRDTTGYFSIDLDMSDYSDINKISSNAENIPNLEDFYIKNMTKGSVNSKVTAQISFYLNNTSNE